MQCLKEHQHPSEVTTSTSVVTFIGVDLAWQSERNPTGIAVARADAISTKLIAVSSGIIGLDKVVAFVEGYSTDHTVIAVDAPLIIRNETGCRPCESQISHRFAARHAGAHSSNLRRFPDRDTHNLVRQMESAGFRHAVPEKRRPPGRWFFEVYPHPAQVVLFGLDTILKYKRKSGRSHSARLREFARLESLLVSLRNAEPRLDPEPGALSLSEGLESLKGNALKNREDALDAWFCAYLALHAWFWGAERNEIVGEFETGWIVLPTAPLHVSV